MNHNRRRRRYIRWCRYVNRAHTPFDAWRYRAPGCDEPRPSGLVRAWDQVALDARRGWPWRPRIKEPPGSRLGWSATMVHDLVLRARMAEETRRKSQARKGDPSMAKGKKRKRPQWTN